MASDAIGKRTENRQLIIDSRPTSHCENQETIQKNSGGLLHPQKTTGVRNDDKAGTQDINPIKLKESLLKKQEYLNFIEKGGYAKDLTDFDLEGTKTQINQAIRDLDKIIEDCLGEPDELEILS